MATGTTQATLVSGYARIESADLVNLSIASVRARYGQVASIPAGARAQVNGNSVDENTILQNGDTLVFDMPTGRKGA